jgi:4-hydroxythreonine-4-phosphate dehydrogenase
MGDPVGVGPEIIIAAARSGALRELHHPVVVAGDLSVLTRACEVFSEEAVITNGSDFALATDEIRFSDTTLPVCVQSSLQPEQIVYGQSGVAAGQAMANYISWAAERCINGDAAGMVTAPINKQALQAAGADFPGHTEMLAERCGVDKVVMMLAGETLKVCLVTTHCALQEVSPRLSIDNVLETIRISHDSMQRQFGLANPRLAVLALNPHAGEGGIFGDEETCFIAPAIEAARAEGVDASGPHSADTLFHFAIKGHYDAVVCMYHDQGLIPLKLLHFADSVNVTLGLPIVRTSVDHGTAYDLAGKGQASPASLIAALKMADEMAQKSNYKF